MIAGALAPDSGAITFAGEPITGLTPDACADAASPGPSSSCGRFRH